jgi:hypothetical protein
MDILIGMLLTGHVAVTSLDLAMNDEKHAVVRTAASIVFLLTLVAAWFLLAAVQ